MVDILGKITEHANFQMLFVVAIVISVITFAFNSGMFAVTGSNFSLMLMGVTGGSLVFWVIMSRNSKNIVYRDAIMEEPFSQRALDAQYDGRKRYTMFEKDMVAWQWEGEKDIMHAAQVIEVKLSKLTAHDMNSDELARMTRDYEGIMNTGDVEIVTVHARKKVQAKDWISKMERKRDNLEFDAQLGGRATHGEKALQMTATLQRVKTNLENVYDSRFFFIIGATAPTMEKVKEELRIAVNSILDRMRDQLKLEVSIVKDNRLLEATNFFRVYSALGSFRGSVNPFHPFRTLSFDTGWHSPFAVPRLPPLSKLIKGIYIGKVMTTGQPVHWDPEDPEMGSPHTLFIGPTGCMRRGQKILMHDGSTKTVEDVKVGDALMGPDSNARNVLELNRGVGKMVKIIPIKGTPFVVNEDHVLTLVRTNTTLASKKNGQIVDVSVKDWMTWSKTQKHLYKLFHVSVDFSTTQRQLIDPYFLGVLLGDGGFLDVISVTTADPEIVETVMRQSRVFGLHVNAYSGSSGKAKIYKMAGRNGGDVSTRHNALLEQLRSLHLAKVSCEDKFIPRSYLTGSRTERLKLLAGLLDTDGSTNKSVYDFISKSMRLASDTSFVARSLGFRATQTPTWKQDQWGHWGLYHRVCVSGDLSLIPCRVKRKMCAPRGQKKSPLRNGFKAKRLREEEYFGFALDKDGRYLLEDFTVTHNSGKTTAGRTFLIRAMQAGIPYWVIDPAGDYTEFTRKLGGTVVNFQNVTVNPFVLYDRNPNSVAKEIVDMTTLVTGLQGPERYFLQERIMESYAAAGVNVSKPETWTDEASNNVHFQMLYKNISERLKKNLFPPTDSLLARGVLQKIQDLSEGSFALRAQNLNLDDLFKQKIPICFYVHEALGESLRKMLAWTLVMQLRALMFTRYQIAETLRLFLMVDEAHHFVKAMVNPNLPGGRIDTPLVAFIREMRKKGVACWLLSQAPEDFMNIGERTSPIFLNVGTILMMGKADQAYMDFVTHYMGLSEDDAWGPNGLYWMTRHGQGILKKSNDPRPIPIQVEAAPEAITGGVEG